MLQGQLESSFKFNREVMGRYKGKILHWDVVNEAISEDGTMRKSVFYDTFGLDYIRMAFKLAREVDPNAKLFYNEYGVYGDDYRKNKTEALYNLIKQLKDEIVPIDGVGFQCHLTTGKFPRNLGKTMLRIAHLGVDVAITELDISIRLPATVALLRQQANDYAQAYKTCLTVRRCVGVTVWQFSDKYTWINKDVWGAPNLFDVNFNPKPAVSAVLNVLKN